LGFIKPLLPPDGNLGHAFLQVQRTTPAIGMQDCG